MARKTKVQTRKLADLTEHPAQQELFGDAPDHEIAELAASMAKDGMKVPVEILPDGTIIAGHQRVRAASSLGWDEIDVVVRHDLADDPAAAECSLIDDNLVRRQVGGLAMARLYSRLVELREFEQRGAVCDGPRVSPIQQLAKRLGCSRRNLDRYLAVLRAPREVQDAFDSHQLSLVDASEVAALPEAMQEKIVQAIILGEEPAVAVANVRKASSGQVKNPMTALRRFVKHIGCAADDMEGHIHSLHGVLPANCVAELKRGRRLIDQVLKQVSARSAKKGQRNKNFNALLNKLQPAPPRSRRRN